MTATTLAPWRARASAVALPIPNAQHYREDKHSTGKLGGSWGGLEDKAPDDFLTSTQAQQSKHHEDVGMQEDSFI